MRRPPVVQVTLSGKVSAAAMWLILSRTRAVKPLAVMSKLKYCCNVFAILAATKSDSVKSFCVPGHDCNSVWDLGAPLCP